MQLKSTIVLGLIALFSTVALAQERYVDEVFTDDQIVVTSDVYYATNADAFPLIFGLAPEFIPTDLFFDVYEPDQSVDDVSDRPVVIVAHGGDGLPQFINTVCWGDKGDWHTVAIARQVARQGFVAVVPNYRTGWNPLAPTQDLFLDGLVDASFRIQQDFRACARFLRKDVAEDGNTYDIDADKLTLWGVSTSAGTYALGAGYINSFDEVQTETFFVTDAEGNIRQTVDEAQLGNLEGTVVGMTADGDTTNYVNTPGYSSEFGMIVSATGISLDPGALDPGEPPLIMFGNPNSAATQFPIGPITLPSTGEVVALVQLSQGVIVEANEMGLNQEWIDAGLIDDMSMSQQMDPNFGAQEGWFPFYGDANNDYPYIWWDQDACSAVDPDVNANSLDGFPGADQDYALMQIDSMGGFFGARACITFDLDCAGVSTNTREPILAASSVEMAPNPTNGAFRIQTANGEEIQDISIFTTTGQLVRNFVVDNDQFTEDALQLPAGYYNVVVRLEAGLVTKKLVVR